jgi:hypothetical protein
LPSWGEIENKIRRDLDLQDTDNFVGQDEMAGYGNEAIATAEAMIMATNEDYFLKSTPLTLVLGASDIDLPSDIYGQKIREIVYKNGDQIWPLTALKDPKMFYQKAVIDRQAVSMDEYKYFLKSATAGVQDKLVLVPAALENGAFLEMWYIRNANRIPLQDSSAEGATRATQVAAVIDIPEWRLYIEQYCKMRIYEKLKEPDKMADSEKKLQQASSLLINDLADRKKDNENQIAMDISHYVESN